MRSFWSPMSAQYLIIVLWVLRRENQKSCAPEVFGWRRLKETCFKCLVRLRPSSKAAEKCKNFWCSFFLVCVLFASPDQLSKTAFLVSGRYIGYRTINNPLMMFSYCWSSFQWRSYCAIIFDHQTQRETTSKTSIWRVRKMTKIKILQPSLRTLSSRYSSQSCYFPELFRTEQKNSRKWKRLTWILALKKF